MSADQPCSCRRRVMTALSCARCNKPICPDCSVITVSGQFCRACSKGGGLALLQPEPRHLAAAAGACLAAGLAGGWLLTVVFNRFGMFRIWGAFLYGLLVAEAALRASGRKRGLKMEILVGLFAAFGILVPQLINIMSAGELGIVDALLILFQNFWDMLLLGVAVVSAVARIRNL